MIIRTYQPKDYDALKSMYENSGWFDPETDKKDRLTDNILLAFDGSELVGTVTLLDTGRHALFFRLLGKTDSIRNELLKKGEELFQKIGYSETHILAPEEDNPKHNEYINYGFKKGKQYRWFWKETDHK